MKVDTHISGSHCVVWKHKEHYLDCRVHGDTMTLIEAVRNGHVYRREFAFNKEAPEVIIRTIKQELV